MIANLSERGAGSVVSQASDGDGPGVLMFGVVAVAIYLGYKVLL